VIFCNFPYETPLAILGLVRRSIAFEPGNIK